MCICDSLKSDTVWNQWNSAFTLQILQTSLRFVYLFFKVIKKMQTELELQRACKLHVVLGALVTSHSVKCTNCPSNRLSFFFYEIYSAIHIIFNHTSIVSFIWLYRKQNKCVWLLFYQKAHVIFSLIFHFHVTFSHYTLSLCMKVRLTSLGLIINFTAKWFQPSNFA